MSEIKSGNFWDEFENKKNKKINNPFSAILVENSNTMQIEDIFKNMQKQKQTYQKSRKNSCAELIDEETEKDVHTPIQRNSYNVQPTFKSMLKNQLDDSPFKDILNNKGRLTATVRFGGIQKIKYTEQVLKEELIQKSSKKSYNQTSQANDSQDEDQDDDDMNSHLDNCEKLLQNYYNEDYFNQENQPSIQDRAMPTVKVKQLKFYSNQAIENEDLGQELYSKYLIKYIQAEKKILIMNERKKMDEILVKGQYSQSLDLDVYNGRYFLYDNSTSQIVIRSIRNTDQLCRFRSQIKRTQPILFLQYQPEVLIVAGGYNKINKQQVVGCDKVEIFRIKKWIIETPKIFKLQYGRISPIIFQMKIANAQSIVILGGNRYGKIVNNKFIFKNYQAENVCVNTKAVLLTKDEIIFALSQASNNHIKAFKNVNVKSQFSLNLHNGLVFKKNSTNLINHKRFDMILIIPNTNKVFKVKYNQNIDLLEICQTNQMLEHKEPIQAHSMNFELNNLNESIVYINKNGELKNTEMKESNHQYRCLLF